MVWLIIIFALFAGLLAYKYKQGGIQDELKKSNNNSLSKYNNITTNHKNFENNANGLFQYLARNIDANQKHPIFNHDIVRIKCIHAGIRNPASHKMAILSRYLLIIPAAFILLIIGGFASGMMNIEYTLLIKFIVFVSGAVLGFYYPIMRLDSMIKDRQSEIMRIFPDFVDIMLVCVGAGMSAEQAYIRIQDDMKKFSITMASEILILSSELNYFLDPETAYRNFIDRTQSDFVRAYASIVLQSIQYGTPLKIGLKSLSKEVREKQMGDLEKKAASLPSKLTLPMMLFTMPVLFVILGFPAAMKVMATF